MYSDYVKHDLFLKKRIASRDQHQRSLRLPFTKEVEPHETIGLYALYTVRITWAHIVLGIIHGEES